MKQLLQSCLLDEMQDYTNLVALRLVGYLLSRIQRTLCSDC